MWLSVKNRSLARSVLVEFFNAILISKRVKMLIGRQAKWRWPSTRERKHSNCKNATEIKGKRNPINNKCLCAQATFSACDEWKSACNPEIHEHLVNSLRVDFGKCFDVQKEWKTSQNEKGAGDGRQSIYNASHWIPVWACSMHITKKKKKRYANRLKLNEWNVQRGCKMLSMFHTSNERH